MNMRNIRLLAVLVTALGLVLLAAGQASAAVTLLTTDDTYTYQGSGGTNYNGLGLLVKSQTGMRRSSWLEFVLGDQVVNTATLNMYLSSIPSGWGTSHTVQIWANQYNFTETTLVYTNAPATTTWTQMTGWTASTTGVYYSANITAFYNANLTKRCTFKVTQSDSLSVGGAYEDGENYYGSTKVPYIFAVPEPSSILALASGIIGIFGLALRRKS